MVHFTKQIETPKGSRKFYFNRIFTVDGVKYHVSVVDTSSCYFIIQKQSGNWKISTQSNVPSWLLDVESELGLAIADKENG
ncbi:MAG: hypothetical protein EOP48_34925 [Sphingobacteriales bacterium]|nr:MAG: hypothetical protein EOP48_34925 [Sphingobacteriales bacterium]